MSPQLIVRGGLGLVLLTGIASVVQAQSAAPRQVFGVFGSIGASYLFRIEDQGFGMHPDIGVMGGVRTRRIGIEGEAVRILGLTPKPAPCGVFGGCVGEARTGFLEASIVGVNVLLFFPPSSGGDSEVYVIGGLGSMSMTGLGATLTQSSPAVPGVFSESTWSARGLAWSVGAGALAQLPHGFTWRLEVRLYDSTVMSGLNLHQFRMMVAAGYGW
jgi:hypothetical protein